MTAPYKVIETRQYTEVVIYDAAGTEVARERQFDNHLYDSTDRVPLTDDEIEDHFPASPGGPR